MDFRTMRENSLYSIKLMLLGLFAWVAAFSFYLSLVTPLPAFSDIPTSVFFGKAWIKQAVLGSLPSFLHALASASIIISLLGYSKRLTGQTLLVLLLVLIVLEVQMGTFDWADIAATIAGLSLTGLFYICSPRSVDRHIRPSLRKKNLAIMLVLGSTALALGSYTQEPGCARYEGNNCVEQKRWGSPIYMDYAQLRSSVQIEESHPLMEIGRLYLYQSLIFMNEKNQGIHIIDNRFPANPTPIAFVRIPGNLEITIRGDYLYADSYVDLVTLDLTDISNIREIKRETDIFPFDAFQNIPYDIAFRFEDIDSSRGVIIGYE